MKVLVSRCDVAPASDRWQAMLTGNTTWASLSGRAPRRWRRSPICCGGWTPTIPILQQSILCGWSDMVDFLLRIWPLWVIPLFIIFLALKGHR